MDIVDYIEKDYNDLSDRTKESFKKQYYLIFNVVLRGE